MACLGHSASALRAQSSTGPSLAPSPAWGRLARSPRPTQRRAISYANQVITYINTHRLALSVGQGQPRDGQVLTDPMHRWAGLAGGEPVSRVSALAV